MWGKGEQEPRGSLAHDRCQFFPPFPFPSIFPDLPFLSFETPPPPPLPASHPPVWSVFTQRLLFGPYSHPGGSVSLSPNFSLLEIFQVSEGFALRVVIHLWVVLHFPWGARALRVCGRSVGFIPIPSWGGTVPCSSAIRSTYVLTCFSASIHTLMPACSWVVGYQSCPLWQTADKFSWVRPTEGPRGRGEGRGWRKRPQVGGERQERAEVGVWGS